MGSGSLVFLVTLTLGQAAPPDGALGASRRIATAIDEFCDQHWRSNGIEPAYTCDDATFLRRAMFDLIGRPPTEREARHFTASHDPHKRLLLVERLISNPCHALHWGNVLDGIVQERRAGNRAFRDFLRDALAKGTHWDELFRRMLMGPWETDYERPANQFLYDRYRSVDEMTNDTARVFFGVDISCTKCHDHPLVDDWKQDHYYGLAAFFHRTFRNKQNNIDEKTKGALKFVDVEGTEKTARPMFLSGRVMEPWPDRAPKTGDAQEAAHVGYREMLVRMALDDGRFFQRAIANRIWAEMMGRGLVHPVDQMHSDNQPSVPGLLEFLGDELAAGGYDLDQLITGIAESDVYQRTSIWTREEPRPAPEHFAVAAVRPLTPQQYAMSLVMTSRGIACDFSSDYESAAAQFLEIERAADELTSWFDARGDEFQSSVREAAFMSNAVALQRLLTSGQESVAVKIAAIPQSAAAVDMAVWAVLGRRPDTEELRRLASWLSERDHSQAACRDLVWALATCAEARFIH